MVPHNYYNFIWNVNIWVRILLTTSVSFMNTHHEIRFLWFVFWHFLYFQIHIILVLESIGSCIACGRAEYRIGDECCPMCSPGKDPLFTSYESPDVNTSSTLTEKHDIVILSSPGNHVHKHCTEFTSTSCVPCVDSTFLDEPNGLIKCKVCTNCDPGKSGAVCLYWNPDTNTDMLVYVVMLWGCVSCICIR